MGVDLGGAATWAKAARAPAMAWLSSSGDRGRASSTSTKARQWAAGPSCAGARWRAPNVSDRRDPRDQLAQHRRTQIRAFGDIEPAEGGGERERSVEGGCGGHGCQPQIGQILFEQRQAAARGKAGEGRAKRAISIERVDIAVERVLHGQERGIACEAGEAVAVHQRLVERGVGLVGSVAQALDARGGGGNSHARDVGTVGPQNEGAGSKKARRTSRAGPFVLVAMKASRGKPRLNLIISRKSLSRGP